MPDSTNPHVIYETAKAVLEGAVSALRQFQRDVPANVSVKFDRPPQDCCPELVVWGSNFRHWDQSFGDGHYYPQLICLNSYAVDITIRIGRCYMTIDQRGNPLDSGMVELQSKELYYDGDALYVGWINEWRAGNIPELSHCTPVNLSNMTPYDEGGCAGWEFTITVGID